MTFHFEPELVEYMEQKGHKTVCVEVITANSDIDFTDIYVHLVKPAQAEELVERKRYRAVETEHGTVLLPPYRLSYDDDVTFGLKRTWIFRSVRYEGIRL